MNTSILEKSIERRLCAALDYSLPCTEVVCSPSMDQLDGSLPPISLPSSNQCLTDPKLDPRVCRFTRASGSAA